MNAEMNMHNANPGTVNIPSPWLNPPPPNNIQTDSLTAQQVALNDQIRESETNLSAQHEVSLFYLQFRKMQRSNSHRILSLGYVATTKNPN